MMSSEQKKSDRINPSSRQPPAIADPVCPVCHRILVPHYQALLREAPRFALRAAERPCDCTPVATRNRRLMLVIATVISTRWQRLIRR